VFPTDEGSGLQELVLPEAAHAPSGRIRLAFTGMSDFYGRLVTYSLGVFGLEEEGGTPPGED